MGINGVQTVGDELAARADRRRIGHGSCRDQKAASEAGLPETIELPSCDVVDELMNTGGEARCFAQYMRIHALEASRRIDLCADGALIGGRA